ncbi:KpsF/GutQ family sugar-phosphate isomerase, partial [Flavobacteriaceae bacterium]|nr:KpsF/GutQ family sugar-phosphate isomerase [Flavobacteriaceae bacterium]
LNSTGTPSIFMHAADAIHGDLGLIQKNDVVVCISKSGNTPEIKALVPFIKANDSNKLIAITGDINSFLATSSDFVLNSNVEKEACPNNLAPTTSTTAQLVIGDAIAVTLLKLRGFDSKDFAKYHPGGSLGKKLYLKVKDLCDTKNKPVININANIGSVIVEMSEKMLGAVVVLNNSNEIMGIITDGDLRRQLVKSLNISKIKAKEIMTKNPLVINANTMAIDALKLMKSKKISHLIVEQDNRYHGIIHIQNIIKEGII